MNLKNLTKLFLYQTEVDDFSPLLNLTLRELISIKIYTITIQLQSNCSTQLAAKFSYHDLSKNNVEHEDLSGISFSYIVVIFNL